MASIPHRRAKTAAFFAGAILAAGAALSGCTAVTEPVPTSTAPVVQLGAPGEPNRTLSPEEQQQLESTAHTELDAEFMRDMMHHHLQAVDMVALVDDRAESDGLRVFTERMGIAQSQEMEQMEQWLQERGEPVRSEHGHDELMPGMLTEEQMDALAAAEGVAFERLFLESMIAHHRGAITMAEQLREADGGQEIVIGDFLLHLESDQSIEIDRMQQMLADLP